MTPTRRTVQDIAFCEIDGEPSEVLSLPLAQIVQDGDLEVLSGKHAYQVRPDEAGPPVTRILVLSAVNMRLLQPLQTLAQGTSPWLVTQPTA